jgi:hypothetical protein
MASKNVGDAVSNAARVLGKRGGKKGGPARARQLTAAERKKIAAMGGKAKNEGK